MRDTATPDFNTFERQGWEQAAAGYDALIGSVARRLDEEILSETRVNPGDDLLDVGCGPGHLASVAVEMGARATGVDVAQAMLDRATANYPALRVRLGNAEDLSFSDQSFDVVVGNLVVLHLARPEAAAAEAARVLRPGGRLALTTWDLPERCRFLGVMIEALAAGGATTPSTIPSGPAFFRFADDDQFAALLTAAGFSDIAVRRIGFEQPVASADALWDGIVEGSVRTSALIRGQPARIQHQVRAALDEALVSYAGPSGYRLPVSFVLASGRRR